MSVLVSKSGAVQRIEINRPERRNALNAAVVQGIGDGIRKAQADAEIRVIVLTGSGDKAFCAGGDLAPAADGAPFTVDPAHPRNPVVDLFKLMEQCDLPIIARVNGHALAGGFGLVCACDMAIASDAATFGVPESKIGLFPMMIMPYMLRVMPLRRFMELCMTGEPISAARAMDWGIVNETVPADQLDARVDALTALLAQRSPSAIRLGKQGFHAMRDMAVLQALEYAQLMLPMMARTEDAKEGMRAFQEKRAPDFKGN
ncbi:enoyl-CoA hydratase-related protein [Ferrovibrio sp.]|uniref:enoyl-CoA hydratase-related protein n=1 Tax=Ferrovibrio sp. TaxID=1917215 RepID=UPI0035B0A11F